MKKLRLLFAAAAAAGVLLTGCGAENVSFTPAESCIYIDDDGMISSALVERFEGVVDIDDLQQYLEAAVIRFNQESGAEGLAANKAGAERLPAALQSVIADESSVKVIFDYASAEDLIRFRQTEDNEDNSNTISALEAKPAKEAMDWFLSEDFAAPDGSQASLEDIKKDTSGIAFYVEGGGVIRTEGKITFLALDAEVKDEYTVTVPEGGKAYVVFK